MEKDKECSLLSNKHISYSNIHQDLLNHSMIIQNFDDFDELNLNCDLNLEVLVLIFVPNKEIFLDNTFSFSKLFFYIKFENTKAIDFVKIKGFNQKSFGKTYKYFDDINFTFQNSKLDFYMNEAKIDEKNCKLPNFNKSTNLFGPIKNLVINIDVFFSKKTCPYVFMNTKLVHLTLGQITNSLILKNQLEFLDINQKDDFDLNNQDIFFLNIGIAFEDITTRLIDKYVFKYINRLLISGVVESIQEDLFSRLKYLGFIYLNFDNFGNFIHNSDNKWMKYLNSDVKVNLKNQREVKSNLVKSLKIELFQKSKVFDTVRTFGNIYMYPDEDFCLFKYFPHDHLVYTSILSGDILKCTCTIIWLIQYIYFYDTTKFHNKNSDYFINFYYQLQDDFKNHSVLICLEKDLKAQIKECNFPKRLSNCEGYKIEKKIGINDFDVLFDLKWMELLIFIFLQPILCFIGIITNLMSILTLSQKIKSKNEKDYSMYKHITMNSIFNFIYCNLTLLRLINVCVFKTSIFCSSIYTYESTQYFRIIFIYYIGNIIKLCSNISYISFSISRFTLSANNKNRFLLKFENINLKIYYTVTILFCSSISLFKLFQYQINEIYNTTKSFPLELFDVDNCRDENFKCKLFRGFNLINHFIIDFVFFLINIIIDLYLLEISKKFLKNKKKITLDKKILDSASKSNKKITKMVLINGLLFFIAYAPQFLSRILLLAFDKYLFKFCFLYYSCKNLTDLAEFFTFFSISFQFFLYKKFNNKFSEQFRLLKKKMASCFKL